MINFATAWEALAADQPDRLAAVCGSNRLLWGDYEQRAARLAAGLAAAGVEAPGNVALFLYNCNEYLETQFAAFKLRLAPCNVNYRYVGAELAYLIDNSDAEALVFDHDLADTVDAVRSELDRVKIFVQVGSSDVPEWAIGYEDLLAAHEPLPAIERDATDQWILYTGGTTGNPKGVVWTHEALQGTTANNFRSQKLEPPSTPDEVLACAETMHAKGRSTVQLAASPLMHGTASIAALSTHLQGGTVVTMPGVGLDADVLWQTVQQERCTIVTIVGDAFSRPMLAALDEADAAGHPYDLSSVFLIMSSGTMWSQEVKNRFLARADLRLFDALGSSEGSGLGHKTASRDADATTAKFQLGEHAAVFTEDGRRVAPGSEERGMLAVSGPIPLGYYGDPVKTAETFREIDGTRWSLPGDWATVEADGSITLLGRGSQCINTGGEKVWPEEVEEALKRHDDVTDCNVVGVPDEKWGSAVTAVVEFVPDASASDQELVDSLRATLSGYKLPKRIVRVDRILRAPNGKPDYAWATDQALNSGD